MFDFFSSEQSPSPADEPKAAQPAEAEEIAAQPELSVLLCNVGYEREAEIPGSLSSAYCFPCLVSSHASPVALNLT